VIRPLDDEGDPAAIVSLSLRAWEPVFASLERVLAGSGVYALLKPDWRESQRRAVEHVCSASDTPVWVAVDEDDDVVVGFVAVALDHAEGIGEISMVAVDPAHQHRGIAAMLIASAIGQFHAAGMALAMVETGGDEGHAPARRCYGRAGFVALPVTRYFRQL
jgi:ribosomal protein S18 acetylase RimI-like enzyme